MQSDEHHFTVGTFHSKINNRFAIIALAMPSTCFSDFRNIDAVQRLLCAGRKCSDM
jgi:hypothetical protein